MSDPRCLQCGACCQFAVVPPFEPQEMSEIPDELSQPIRAVWEHAADPESNFWEQTKTRVCSWFNPDTGECRHYDLRPSACRDFVVESEDCMDMRNRAGVTSSVQLTIGASNARPHD